MKKRTSKIILFSFLCILFMISFVVSADQIKLINGQIIKGTLSRVVPGREVNILVHETNTGQYLSRTVKFDEIDSVKIIRTKRMPDTLVATSGDVVRGTLLGAPLDDPIRFSRIDGSVIEFPAKNVAEIRFGPRILAGATSNEKIAPSFGVGLSLGSYGIGIRRDAIAMFSENWILLASLGIHCWWRNQNLSMGIANEITYMLKIDGVYFGVGTGTLFNMTDRKWLALLNFRIVIPVTFLGNVSTFSVGVSLNL